MNNYYLNFITEGTYKDVYSISLNSGYYQVNNNDKQKILELLNNYNISQSYFENNIDNFVYAESKTESNDFYDLKLFICLCFSPILGFGLGWAYSGMEFTNLVIIFLQQMVLNLEHILRLPWRRRL